MRGRPSPPDGAGWRDALKAEARLLAAVLAANPLGPDDPRDVPQEELECRSLNSGLRYDADPVPEAIRLTLTGLAYLSHRADIAAKGYGRWEREAKRLPPDRAFFVGLCRAFERAFGRWAKVYTNPLNDERGGPAVLFCCAVSRRLADHAAGETAEPDRLRNAVATLRKWASERGVVGEQLRDALAVDLGKGVFRRERGRRCGHGLRRRKLAEAAGHSLR